MAAKNILLVYGDFISSPMIETETLLVTGTCQPSWSKAMLVGMPKVSVSLRRHQQGDYSGSSWEHGLGLQESWKRSHGLQELFWVKYEHLCKTLNDWEGFWLCVDHKTLLHGGWNIVLDLTAAWSNPNMLLGVNARYVQNPEDLIVTSPNILSHFI